MPERPAPRSQGSAALSGLLGRCPRCGEGKLFSGYIALPPACSRCGLDYGFADSGDGPAVFVMLIAGFLALGFVLWFEFAYEPPFWIHLVVSLPVTLGICLALLRLFKGLLIALQYKHDAAEGRLDV
ncbi:DUF983 domain-containing protein [Hansschlegelia zhihuaiae]|uniref:DUF983 domain-containing protein n=1 Tax=Hansschlegelia zhihuaiae TaxID=405005 RepID=A0A4Q0MI49_9HYPH|nr:DUF983 domain-containing protein [Hansschlegelia zhihuaiae]RXF73291.1 DUF983 domain-containing protein [Hansschlegelia zhihuaiae]